MLSTIHEAVEIAAKVDYKGDEIVKPKAIVDYTNLMLGVDLNDQMLTYYSFSRRSSKWWLKMFMHLVNMIFTNSYVLYKKYHKGETTGEDMTHSEYMIAVIEAMIKNGSVLLNVQRRRSCNIDTDSRLVARHFPEQIPKLRESKVLSRKCYICNEIAKKTNNKTNCHWTTFWCANCKKALCVGQRNCFVMYHTQKNYIQNAMPRIENEMHEHDNHDHDDLDFETNTNGEIANINLFLSSVK